MSRVVIVTGSSGGIGTALCKEFMQQNWRVIGVDLNEPSEDLFRFEHADFSKVDAAYNLFQNLKDLDRVDALINNAAICINKPLLETNDKDWQQTFDVNVRSVFQMVRYAHPFLKMTRGSIVNVGSVHAVSTSENVSAYAASKGAITALTRAVALEYASDNIRCNAVLPGAINTEMLQMGLSRRQHPKGAEGNFERLVEQTPLGFIALPDQIVPSIIHLADNESSPYITGQTLVIDGGATAKLATE